MTGMARRIGTAMGLAVLLHVGMAMGAQAEEGAASSTLQAPIIAVIDYERLIQDSSAARSVRTTVDKYQQSMQDDVTKEETVLRGRQQDLENQRKTLSQDAFAEKARAFDGSLAEFQRKLLNRRRALDRSSGIGMAKVQAKLYDITRDVASLHGANVVLPKSVVLMYDEKLNITEEVLVRMDKELPRVDVPAPKLEDDAPGGDAPKKKAN